MRVPKVLCHSGGDLFVMWHADHGAYALILSDHDYPAPASELNLATSNDVSGLEWQPVRVIVEHVREVEEIGPYEHGGEA